MQQTGIHELSAETIDKIAAGEVVERPASVVKELVENAIDADATAITVEIKDGGTSLIRVTDNGVGIPKEDVPKAFLRHATSKIQTAEDLNHIASLGFRGEALSSIAAVSKIEMFTKREEDITASHYVIEGAVETAFDEMAAPEGTSIFVRQLFYNTPARRKFLKSPVTEGNYITEIMERLALSHPGVSIRYIVNGSEKLVTAGSGHLRDVIFEIYGAHMLKELLPITAENDMFSIKGYIGTPVVHRGNRAFESFFVGGRYVKSRLLQKAVEEGYEGYLMQHAYPFCVLSLTFADETCDVNVHPTKQDIRFYQEQFVFETLQSIVSDRLSIREDIIESPLVEQKEKKVSGKPLPPKGAEPFEKNRLQEMKRQIAMAVAEDSPYSRQYGHFEAPKDLSSVSDNSLRPNEEAEQLSFLSADARKEHHIIGQIFGTYWIVEYDNMMYIIDQHAAHEKVLYERFMSQLADKEMTSQQLSPPVIVTLSIGEETALRRYQDMLQELGFSVSHFGGKDYALDAIPDNLYHIDPKTLFTDLMTMLTENRRVNTDEVIKERVASISCKAAVKGNHHLSRNEVDALIDELLTLENPYHCPHGRPTIISMSHYELDKRFKRIL